MLTNSLSQLYALTQGQHADGRQHQRDHSADDLGDDNNDDESSEDGGEEHSGGDVDAGDVRWIAMGDNCEGLRGLIKNNLKGTYGMIFDEFADTMLTQLNTSTPSKNRFRFLMRQVSIGPWSLAHTLPKSVANIANRNSNDGTKSFRALAGLQPRHKLKGAMAHDEQTARHVHKLPGHLWTREWGANATCKLFRVVAVCGFENLAEERQQVYLLAQHLEPAEAEGCDEGGSDNGDSDNGRRPPLLFAPPFRRYKLDGELELIDVSRFANCKQAWIVGVAWRHVQSQDDEERRALQELQLWAADEWVTEPNM
jgi:hypothetical protein